jgi:hypothetical protein
MAATWPEISSVAFAGLVGQRLDFGSDHRKAAATFAGACRLDGRVQRQQVGLLRDRVDKLHHLADLLGAGGQDLHGGVGALGVADRLACDLVRTRHLPRDLRHRARQLFSRGRNGNDVV